ncbi:hypothetical protein CAPN008_11940 [Capnocytophaga canis]|uniref:DUF6291 domain-containing protein n=1 Tax=Capnocytophaga canis TaxID=1848903 RepID=UPI001AC63562|nr:DUF6291 domain-containing protein [Capnocytophaga canis]GIM61144.1 hypothetical protein CAPN008_11940 [Capnocytophaga canis]
MERETFVFYKEWAEAISDLPSEIRLEIYEGIIEYATTGKIPNLKMTARVGFNFVKKKIDKDLISYQKTIEKNRENGKKGGRPKNPKNPLGFQETQPNPKNLDNDNEYDNDISFLEKKKQKTYTSDEGEFLENSEKESLETDLKTEKIQKEKSSAKKEKGFDFLKALLNAGFDPELSTEWLKIRKAKKAVNSEIAFKNFMREVEKSGRSPNEVLALVVQKQWKGFEASWLHNEQFTMNNGQKTNTTSNYPKANAGGGYPTGQKISARAFLAKQYSEQLARNSEAGNITIEVETSPSE